MRSPPLRPSLHLFFLLSLLALVWSPASFPGATAVDVQEVAGLEGDAVGGGPSSSSSSLTLVYFGMPFKIDDLDFSEAAGLTIADVKKRIEAEYAIPATEQSLFLGTSLLDDTATLSAANITPGSTLEVRHEIALKEGVELPAEKHDFSFEELKEYFNIDLASFRAKWEATQEEMKQEVLESVEEGRQILQHVGASLRKLGHFFQKMARKCLGLLQAVGRLFTGGKKGGKEEL
ncbi:hypothetical protein NGA_0174300 [Nannochloropsis gaditana CCMP526]|uniref:Ubiquitin n=1 Tax=Nannochloropsis gaditana TaxID=72520 RepID=W7TIZ6_9STRA|nr:hypothetical protein NGA_0174300 [Nannochloropsis gaditana CCMP526]EKU21783.1 hypothetical protein NGA_0174300 [Nannochloropsis gaditana CCMP526]EWM20311.1 Ubiquitin [Nannochloropsis gaditana]|eukprot:XP_005854577.1 hypothetical protein NGA_0174300 [Nannochloropsis gaditana CCMP526]